MFSDIEIDWFPQQPEYPNYNKCRVHGYYNDTLYEMYIGVYHGDVEGKVRDEIAIDMFKHSVEQKEAK